MRKPLGRPIRIHTILDHLKKIFICFSYILSNGRISGILRVECGRLVSMEHFGVSGVKSVGLLVRRTVSAMSDKIYIRGPFEKLVEWR